MNKKQLFLFLGFSLPYPFLSLYCDIQYDSMLMYGIMILCLIFLFRSAKKGNHRYTVICGNLVSFLLSCGCILLFQKDSWGIYTKPLTPMQVVVSVCIVSVLLQWLVWRSRNRRKE